MGVSLLISRDGDISLKKLPDVTLAEFQSNIMESDDDPSANQFWLKVVFNDDDEFPDILKATHEFFKCMALQECKVTKCKDHPTENQNANESDDLGRTIFLVAAQTFFRNVTQKALKCEDDPAADQCAESLWGLIERYFYSRTKDNHPYENDFKSGHAFHSPVWLELLVGSRAEDLHLENCLDQAASDRDVMYLYGGAWGVHVNSECHDVAEASSLLVMDETDCYPGYSHVRFTTLDEPMIERMSQTYKSGTKFVDNIVFWLHLFTVILLLYLNQPAVCLLLSITWHTVARKMTFFRSGLNDGHAIYAMLRNWKYVPLFDRIYGLFQIGRKNVMRCIIIRSGHFFLSSKVALDLLLDENPRAIFRGPAQTYGDIDYVPALVCSAPFPCVTRYLSRPRSPQWPTKRALEAIATLPGILVPTGKKGSINSFLEWRQSFSVQELYLTRDMPDWVKFGFRSFKLMVKRRKKRNKDTAACDSVQAARSGAEGHCDTQASEVCSYHLKTVLLWELEEMDMDTWRKRCPFQLMIQLRLRLDHHLMAGYLPHYFNLEHDLLDNVPREELMLMREGAI